ncbi:MAG: hypothetical protein ACKV0T_07030 [Planctomycetales bacterium]
MRHFQQMVFYLWVLPVTAAGIILALLAGMSGGSMRLRAGIVEAHGGCLRWLLRGGRLRGGGAAMTLGHAILARDATCLARSRSHELLHVRQFEKWGPLMLPIYWSIGFWLACRGLHPYLDHPFERETQNGRDPD